MPYGLIRETLGLAPGVNLNEHRTYRIWCTARSRCRWRAHHAYARYGGNGVTFCPRWDSFLYFLEDMGHPPTDQHTLDRIDGQGNYEPGNCRWATRKEQNANRENTIWANGMPLKEAAEKAGIKYSTVWLRVKRGWPVDRALSTPVDASRHYQFD